MRWGSGIVTSRRNDARSDRPGRLRGGAPQGRWRLLVDGPRDGPTNMAVDEALARGCAEGWAPPTLRLYRWSVPTVSLGYNQAAHGAVDLAACGRRGVGVVRRVTGGRALLHQHELTYSLALPTPAGHRGVLTDYRWISRCLLLAVQRLGVPATISRGQTPQEAGGLCFLSTSRYELTVGGRKLIGSAQRRFDKALLQHGSLLIEMDRPAWEAVFPRGGDLERRATTLQALLGRFPLWEEVTRAVQAGFEEGAGARFEPGELTDREREVIQDLTRTRYAAATWTLRR